MLHVLWYVLLFLCYHFFCTGDKKSLSFPHSVVRVLDGLWYIKFYTILSLHYHSLLHWIESVVVVPSTTWFVDSWGWLYRDTGPLSLTLDPKWPPWIYVPVNYEFTRVETDHLLIISTRNSRDLYWDYIVVERVWNHTIRKVWIEYVNDEFRSQSVKRFLESGETHPFTINSGSRPTTLTSDEDPNNNRDPENSPVNLLRMKNPLLCSTQIWL